MTRQIHVGNVAIGGGAPVSIQSMTNTPTHDVEATLAQIRALAAAGCEIVRVAVPDERAAQAVAALKAGSPLPLVADIHFDYRLALTDVEGGIDKIRINALWRSPCWRNTAAPPQRPWWRVPWATWPCWRSTALRTSASP